jgi:hypothetical protein
MRSNFKVALYVCLVVAIGITIIGAAFGFKSAQDEDIFFVVKIAAMLGVIISIVGLKATDGKSN